MWHSPLCFRSIICSNLRTKTSCSKACWRPTHIFSLFSFFHSPLETTVFFVLFSKEKDAHCVGASPKPRACGGYLDSSFLVDILSTCGLSTDILVLPRDTNAAFRGACQTRSSESWQRSWDHRDPQGTYSVRRSRCSLAVSLRFLGNIGVVKIDLNN